jgi:peptide deformylase
VPEEGVHDHEEWRGIAGVPISILGAELLGRRCAPVERFDDALKNLVTTMFATMYEAPGVGLAANQIGVDARVFVIDCPDDAVGRLVGHVVNPVFVETDGPRELQTGEEGCLSVPGVRAEVTRLMRVVVSGTDQDASPVRLEGYGLAARCLQHEMDHLDGRLYLDRLTLSQRRTVVAEYQAAQSS